MFWYVFWIALFVAIMFFVGIYHYRRITGVDEYLVASWSVGFWPIVGTILATWVGSAAFVGGVGLGYEFGVSGFLRLALPAATVSLLLCVLFAARLRRTKLYTLPDLFDERFGRPTGLLPALLSAFIYAVPTLALQYVAMGFLFSTLFGLPLWGALIASWALIYGYTLLGGLPSVIVTDTIQSGILFVGIIMMGIAAYLYAGGMGEISSAVPESHLSLLGADPAGTIFFALSIGPFYLVWQTTWQRFYASRTERIATWAPFTGFLIGGIFIGIISTLIGMAGRSFITGDNVANDAVFYTVLQDVLPPFLGGILAMALMAAVVSGGDSFIMQGSSNLTRDVYQRYFNPTASSERLLTVSRWSATIIAILGLLVSFAVTDIVTLYTYALKWIGVTLVIPFLAIMFWRRVTRTGVISGMILALAATIIWELLGRPLGLHEAAVGYIVMLASLIPISLATAHNEGEQVVALWSEDLRRSDDSGARDPQTDETSGST